MGAVVWPIVHCVLWFYCVFISLLFSPFGYYSINICCCCIILSNLGCAHRRIYDITRQRLRQHYFTHHAAHCCSCARWVYTCRCWHKQWRIKIAHSRHVASETCDLDFGMACAVVQLLLTCTVITKRMTASWIVSHLC